MGGRKLTLPWPPDVRGEGDISPCTTIVAAAFDTIAPFCHEVIVVTGHDRDGLVAALGRRPFREAPGSPDGDMFDSIHAGLDVCAQADPARPVLLHPGDQPEVQGATIRMLLEASRANPDLVILPTRDGRGGHPVLIPPAMLERIREWRAASDFGRDGPERREGGLAGFWRSHAAHVLRLSTTDAGACRDIDTPADYRAASAP